MRVDRGKILRELAFVDPAPEAQVAPIFFPHRHRVHVRGALQRPDRIDARRHELRDHEIAVPVRVDHHPAHAGRLEPRHQPFHLRKNKRAVGLGAEQRSVLHTQVFVEKNVVGPHPGHEQRPRRLDREVRDELHHLVHQRRLVVPRIAEILRAHPLPRPPIVAERTAVLPHDQRVLAPLPAGPEKLLPIRRVTAGRRRPVALLDRLEIRRRFHREIDVLVHARPHAFGGARDQRLRNHAVRPLDDLGLPLAAQHFFLEGRNHVETHIDELPRVHVPAALPGKPVPVQVRGRQPFVAPALLRLHPDADLVVRRAVDRLIVHARVETFERSHGKARWSM